MVVTYSNEPVFRCLLCKSVYLSEGTVKVTRSLFSVSEAQFFRL